MEENRGGGALGEGGWGCMRGDVDPRERRGHSARDKWKGGNSASLLNIDTVSLLGGESSKKIRLWRERIQWAFLPRSFFFLAFFFL